MTNVAMLMRWAALSAIGAGALLMGGAGGAGAAASNDTCPATYQAITVEQAVSEGYLRVAIFDANGDGVVCRLPLGKGVGNHLPVPPDFQVYNRLDNATPRL